MDKKHRSMLTIFGLLAIFIIIQACSLPIGRKTEPAAEVIIAPAKEKTEGQPPTAAPIQEPTHTPEIKLGSLSGEVFFDTNRDGIRQGAEENWYEFTYRIFYLTEGYCGNGGETVNKKSSEVSRAYFFGGLIPGPYCLSMNDMQYITTTLPIDITIANGEIKIKHIGFWNEQ